MLRSTCKMILPALTGLLVLSCSSSKNATTVKREDVRGTWILNNINTEGIASSERVKITILDEGSPECLTGSTWVLPNNGNGSYTLPDRSGCSSGKRDIVWSYRTEADQPVFQFKKMESGVKARDIKEGYKFKVLSADDNSMVLQSEVSYTGRPVYIKYYFSKS
jgi:hypothetical protein